MTRLNESHWIFGFGVHLHFPGGGAPMAKAPIGTFATREGCSAVSDEQGNLLFYTDGVTLFDSQSSPVQSNLGGATSSTHSAIIVPPAGGGVEYHVFAVGEEFGPADRIMHSSYQVTGSSVVTVSAPQAVGTTLSNDATERLAATSHADCDKYWVAAQNEDEELIAFLVDGDTAAGLPQAVTSASQPWARADRIEIGQMKFSPNGELLAYCDRAASGRVVVLGFDPQTGAFAEWLYVDQVRSPYGLEFSPSSEFLYYSASGGVRQLTIPPAPDPTNVRQDSAQPLVTSDALWGLQLGPDDRIYGARQASTIAAIAAPDIPVPGSDYKSVALDATDNPLNLGATGQLGLPSFTRIADRCRTIDCKAISAEVDAELINAMGEHHESMEPCDYPDDGIPWRHPNDPAICDALDFDRPEPTVFITHSDSDCDCLESDDVEIMSITICNRYTNITLTDVTIPRIEVVDANGAPPPLLPDGTPSIVVAPIGPHCFGDIPPCSCVSRQFVMRLRGAQAGTYKLQLPALCFDWNVAESQARCFEFEVCAD